MVDMHAIGAGGGSIAKVEAGALKVGPESASADPGPICYGKGGKRPTVTDANLLLGYLNPVALCGGEFKLSSSGVKEAVLEQIGKPLGLDAIEAAYGIYRIVNANMSNAIRRVSSQAGDDPRGFSMVVYGGNGPIHAGQQAEELGIKKLIVPKTSPAFSALGLLIADRVIEAQRSYIRPAKRARQDEVEALFAEMANLAAAEFARSSVAKTNLLLRRSLQICYPGQTFDMQVPMKGDLASTIEAFHDLHEELHTYAARDQEPIVRAVRLETIAAADKPELRVSDRRSGGEKDALTTRRPVYFAGGFVETPIYDGDKLHHGHRIEGPAVVEERFTTIVLGPGHVASWDAHDNCVVSLP
jgi:N-methylhydantoinase A